MQLKILQKQYKSFTRYLSNNAMFLTMEIEKSIGRAGFANTEGNLIRSYYPAEQKHKGGYLKYYNFRI